MMSYNTMRPTVLLGEFSGKRVPRIQAIGWGRMYIARPPRPYEGEPWGFDNGAFAVYTKRGKPIEISLADESKWIEKFERRLERAYEMTTEAPLLAVVPDRPFRSRQSLVRSAKWLTSGKLPRDWPWYLAVQDGMETTTVSNFIHTYRDRLTGLFLGGSSEFKGEAGRWCNLAQRWGLAFHYGRAGTVKKLHHAHQVGADSLDSAFPMWTEERWTGFENEWLGLPLAPAAELIA